MVELAELLVDDRRHADWAILAKNGTDATTMCCTIARAQTGRSKILVAKGAYHGAAPWCTPARPASTPADRANLLHYPFNDLAVGDRGRAEAGDDLAAIVVSPFKHDARYDQELVDPAFASGLRAICDDTGAALILDDVRCGFRLPSAPAGSRSACARTCRPGARRSRAPGRSRSPCSRPTGPGPPRPAPSWTRGAAGTRPARRPGSARPRCRRTARAARGRTRGRPAPGRTRRRA